MEGEKVIVDRTRLEELEKYETAYKENKVVYKEYVFSYYGHVIQEGKGTIFLKEKDEALSDMEKKLKELREENKELQGKIERYESEIYKQKDQEPNDAITADNKQSLFARIARFFGGR